MILNRHVPWLACRFVAVLFALAIGSYGPSANAGDIFPYGPYSFSITFQGQRPTFPSQVLACEYPPTSLAADFSWSALLDLDGNPSTTNDQWLVSAYTLCDIGSQAGMVDLATSLVGEIDKVDVQSGSQTFYGSVAVGVYGVGVTIFIDRRTFPGSITSSTRVKFLSQHYYTNAYAFDVTPDASLGIDQGEFHVLDEPNGDVQNCAPPCDVAGAWHDIVDLSTVWIEIPADSLIFANGFDRS